MGNIAQIYAEAIRKPKEEQKEQPKQEDAAHAQLRLSWENSTITKELLDTIDMQIDVLVVEAISHAVAYPIHKNLDGILQALVRADTLIKTKAKMIERK